MSASVRPACVLQVSEKRSEAERETRKRERLEKEARDLRAQVDAKNDEVSSHATSTVQLILMSGIAATPATCGSQQLLPSVHALGLISSNLGTQCLHGWCT